MKTESRGKQSKVVIYSEEDCYHALIGQILYQTILDYTLAAAKLFKPGRKIRPGKYTEACKRSLRSCEEFFSNTPYDYGDIDLQYVQRLCLERAIGGSTRYYFDKKR